MGSTMTDLALFRVPGFPFRTSRLDSRVLASLRRYELVGTMTRIDFVRELETRIRRDTARGYFTALLLCLSGAATEAAAGSSFILRSPSGMISKRR